MINVPKLPHETLGFKMAGNGKKTRRIFAFTRALSWREAFFL